MRYGMIGAGAMGYRFGVMLQEIGGFEVDFIDTWQPNLDAVRAQGGVWISRDGQNRHLVPIHLFTPEEYRGAPDAWIVFVKQMQLAETLERCRGLFRPGQLVFTAMNGMGHIERLQEVFPDEAIVAGTAVIATILKGPGEADFMGARGLEHTSLAALDGRTDGPVQAFSEDFARAELGPEISDNVQGTLLAKVIFNSVSNSLCTMFQIPVGAFGAYAGSDAMTEQLVTEAYAALDAAGITPVQTREEAIAGILHACRDLLPGHYPSMFQDFIAGRPTEVDAINGYLARLGRAHGVACPTHEFVVHLVHLAEESRRPRS
ncbi:MAG: ketopantoate reductase family protein [Microbacteriaceae bacterium]|nr:ketopantoate reductase family protein [Microbacteriaceae bacterium]MCI1207014.1 ketopantoate reductase family protein [Microbacteriaceae bacterium]